ncbi:nuclear transport factor 2 family protein [Microbulbifer sp. SAOS-129_SWC]|uniref:nuclear transport factor 2 family protein n=1 Tax=Microbulbifer sp. SAOS-129_SWC TaxID=3145235 RepID=UPI003217A17D
MAETGNAELATKFLSMVAAGNVREAYDRYVAKHFQHHNAYFPSDRESLLLAMEQSAEAEPNKSFTIKQVIDSGVRVAVYSHLKRAAVPVEYAVVHILRFECGQIVEMWDLGQEIPTDSPNDLGMF